MTIEIIEDSCRAVADARNALRSQHEKMQQELERVHRQYRPGLLLLIERWQNARADLLADLEVNAELFTRPRTQTFSGVKVGFTTQQSVVEFDDEQLLIEKIEKRFAKKTAAHFVKTEKTIRKKALYGLPQADHDALGIRMTEQNDKIVLTDIEGEFDKLIKALAKEQDELEGAA